MKLENMLGQAVQCNNLRKTMLNLNLSREQKLLIEQQNELSYLQERVKFFTAYKRNFKKKFYSLLINANHANDKNFIAHIDDRRKAKSQELQSKIHYAQEQIAKINELIASIKAKLKQIEHKLEKFRLLPEMIDDEFSGSYLE